MHVWLLRRGIATPKRQVPLCLEHRTTSFRLLLESEDLRGVKNQSYRIVRSPSSILIFNVSSCNKSRLEFKWCWVYYFFRSQKPQSIELSENWPCNGVENKSGLHPQQVDLAVLYMKNLQHFPQQSRLWFQPHRTHRTSYEVACRSLTKNVDPVRTRIRSSLSQQYSPIGRPFLSPRLSRIGVKHVTPIKYRGLLNVDHRQTCRQKQINSSWRYFPWSKTLGFALG